MEAPKLIGLRWHNNKLELNYYGLATFRSNEKPNIPGIDFDTFLHYEPSANRMEYVYNGVGYQMTIPQQDACKQYVSSIDIPGFAYDPLRDNIYMGIKTNSEARTSGYKLTYVPITTDYCKFNETKNTWDVVYAIICQEGRPFLTFNNTWSKADDETAPSCAAEMQDALLLLTEEEWNVVSKNRKRDTDIFDLASYTWIDERKLNRTKFELRSRVSSMLQNWSRTFDEVHFNGFNVSDIFKYLDQPYDFTNVIFGTYSELRTDGEIQEVRDLLTDYRDKLTLYTNEKNKVQSKLLATELAVRKCETLAELDELEDYISNELYTELFKELNEMDDEDEDD